MVGVMVLETLGEKVEEGQALAQEVMLGETDTVWLTERVRVTLLVMVKDEHWERDSVPDEL